MKRKDRDTRFLVCASATRGTAVLSDWPTLAEAYAERDRVKAAHAPLAHPVVRVGHRGPDGRWVTL